MVFLYFNSASVPPGVSLFSHQTSKLWGVFNCLNVIKVFSIIKKGALWLSTFGPLEHIYFHPNKIYTENLIWPQNV